MRSTGSKNRIGFVLFTWQLQQVYESSGVGIHAESFVQNSPPALQEGKPRANVFFASGGVV